MLLNTCPLEQATNKSVEVLSTTFETLTGENSALPECLSSPWLPGWTFWLTPKLNESISMWPSFALAWPVMPSIFRYALIAIKSLLKEIVELTGLLCRRRKLRHQTQ